MLWCSRGGASGCLVGDAAACPLHCRARSRAPACTPTARHPQAGKKRSSEPATKSAAPGGASKASDEAERLAKRAARFAADSQA